MAQTHVELRMNQRAVLTTHSTEVNDRRMMYPDYLMPMAGMSAASDDPFDAARESLLLSYGYNTARAYWGDLEHWRDWCRDQEPPVQSMAPSADAVAGYLSQLAAWEYSPNTVARRLTTLRA